MNHAASRRVRIAVIYAILVLLNVGAWAALLLAARVYPLLLALGVTAYVLGLRHAVDADHVAAIDGTIRNAIAAANTVVLMEILRSRGDARADVTPGGLLARVLRPALRLVCNSAHMYPVGVLFGLGFDTATEIALLGISAASGAGGMPIVYVLLLPWLFVAGMSLVDTTEGIATLGAYGCAQVRPARRMLYTVGVTVIAIAGPLLVGGAEAIAALKAL